MQGQHFIVEVAEGGDISEITPAENVVPFAPAAVDTSVVKLEQSAPLSGNIFKVHVSAGDMVKEGDVVIILEAMKMETEIRAEADGVISQVWVKEGDSVSVGSQLLALA